MLLVTGATGQLGGAVVSFLLKKIPASEIAVLARDAAKASKLKEQGVDVRIGDYHNSESLEKAFQGVDTLLLISSSDFSDRLGQHKRAVDAAKKAGVKHIIYTGVTMKDYQKSAIAEFMGQHFATEDYIKESGITYTFFRNGLYADVLPMFIGQDPATTGVFIPAGEGKVAYVVREDIAEALANVLTSTGHENKTYPITGSALYSYADIASILSDIYGKTVPYISPDQPTFFAALKAAGVPDMYIGVTYGFADATKHHHFEEVDPTLENLLGRRPVGVEAYLNSVYAK